MASLLTDNLGVWWALISEYQVNVLTQSITRTVDMEHNVCKTTQDVITVELLCSRDGNYLWRTIYMDGTRTLHAQSSCSPIDNQFHIPCLTVNTFVQS